MRIQLLPVSMLLWLKLPQKAVSQISCREPWWTYRSGDTTNRACPCRRIHQVSDLTKHPVCLTETASVCASCCGRESDVACNPGAPRKVPGFGPQSFPDRSRNSWPLAMLGGLTHHVLGCLWLFPAMKERDTCSHRLLAGADGPIE